MNYTGLTTRYHGVQMRSRLEVRWAIFFDQLGLEWAYEPTKFSLPSGVYVPDFRVSWPSGHALWVEVKPKLDVIRPVDWQRYEEFIGVNRVLLLCDGPPAARAYPYAKRDESRRGPGVVFLPTLPQYSLHPAGAPFDMTATIRAAAVARDAKFRRA